MKTETGFLIIFHTVLLRMRNVWDKSHRKNQNTHFMFNNCFWKSHCLWDNVEKYSRTGRATDDIITYEHCMLRTWGSKHTQNMYLYVIYV